MSGDRAAGDGDRLASEEAGDVPTDDPPEVPKAWIPVLPHLQQGGRHVWKMGHALQVLERATVEKEYPDWSRAEIGRMGWEEIARCWSCGKLYAEAAPDCDRQAWAPVGQGWAFPGHVAPAEVKPDRCVASYFAGSFVLLCIDDGTGRCQHGRELKGGPS